MILEGARNNGRGWSRKACPSDLNREAPLSFGETRLHSPPFYKHRPPTLTHALTHSFIHSLVHSLIEQTSLLGTRRWPGHRTPTCSRTLPGWIEKQPPPESRGHLAPAPLLSLLLCPCHRHRWPPGAWSHEGQPLPPSGPFGGWRRRGGATAPPVRAAGQSWRVLRLPGLVHSLGFRWRWRLWVGDGLKERKATWASHVGTSVVHWACRAVASLLQLWSPDGVSGLPEKTPGPGALRATPQAMSAELIP